MQTKLIWLKLSFLLLLAPIRENTTRILFLALLYNHKLWVSPCRRHFVYLEARKTEFDSFPIQLVRLRRRYSSILVAHQAIWSVHLKLLLKQIQNSACGAVIPLCLHPTFLKICAFKKQQSPPVISNSLFFYYRLRQNTEKPKINVWKVRKTKPGKWVINAHHTIWCTVNCPILIH